MSKSYRLYCAAIGGFLVALATLSGGLSAQQQKPQTPSGTEKPQQQTNPIADPHSLRAIFNEAVEIFTREKAAGADAEQRKEDREKSDLAAQWRQSLWAAVAAIAACVALFVNAVTLWLLWRTFQQTRRTADAAVTAAEAARDSIAESARTAKAAEDSVSAGVRAANAAERTVEVASDTARRQLRAYMSCEFEQDIKPEGKKDFWINKSGCHVPMVARNAGQTPAYGYINWVSVAVAPALDCGRLERAKRKPGDPPVYGPVDVMPGETVTLLAQRSAFTDEQWQHMKSRSHQLYIFGGLYYRDAFKRRRYLRYCYFAPMEPNGRFLRFGTYYKGNRSN